MVVFSAGQETVREAQRSEKCMRGKGLVLAKGLSILLLKDWTQQRIGPPYSEKGFLSLTMEVLRERVVFFKGKLF